MAGELDVYLGVSWRAGGVNVPLGSVQRPVTPTIEVPGTGKLLRKGTLDPEDMALLWEYTEQTDFELLALFCSGYMSIAVKHDAQTSSTDKTPAGTSPTWQHHDLSNHAPFILTTDLGLTHATAATHTGTTSTLPTLWTSGTRVNGRVYALAGWNQDTEDSVDWELWVLN